MKNTGLLVRLVLIAFTLFYAQKTILAQSLTSSPTPTPAPSSLSLDISNLPTELSKSLLEKSSGMITAASGSVEYALLVNLIATVTSVAANTWIPGDTLSPYTERCIYRFGVDSGADVSVIFNRRILPNACLGSTCTPQPGLYILAGATQTSDVTSFSPYLVGTSAAQLSTLISDTQNSDFEYSILALGAVAQPKILTALRVSYRRAGVRLVRSFYFKQSTAMAAAPVVRKLVCQQ